MKHELLTIRVSSPDSLAILGHAFMKEYLYPQMRAPSVPYVVSLYGPKYSGKTGFADGVFSEAMKLDLVGKTLCSRDILNARASIRSGQTLYRHMDTGSTWYNDALRDIAYDPMNGRDYFRAERCQREEMMSDQSHVVRRKTLAGLDIVEHATMPHLAVSTACIFVMSPADIPRSGLYFRTTSESLRWIDGQNMFKGTKHVPDVYTYMKKLSVDAFNFSSRSRVDAETRDVTFMLFRQSDAQKTLIRSFNDRVAGLAAQKAL